MWIGKGTEGRAMPRAGAQTSGSKAASAQTPRQPEGTRARSGAPNPTANPTAELLRWAHSASSPRGPHPSHSAASRSPERIPHPGTSFLGHPCHPESSRCAAGGARVT